MNVTSGRSIPQRARQQAFRSCGVLLMIFWAAHTAQADHLHVYLLAGQSNMDGRALQQGMPANLLSQSDVLLYARDGNAILGNGLVPLQPASNTFNNSLRDFGPELTFGRTMADARPNLNFALIKHAVGSTSLAVNWNPTNGAAYTAFRQTVSNGLTALANAGHTYEIAGFLWMQGESDAFDADQAAAYNANLTALIADVRTRYGADLPFLIGQLPSGQYAPTPPAGHAAVRQAQANVAQLNAMAELIVTDTFTLKADVIHFDALGQQKLGQAFAQAALEFLPVPEPTSLSLLLYGSIALWLIRRKRS